MSYNIQQPAIPNADDKWTAAEHNGHLLLFFPTEIRRGIKTSNGDADAVACSRVVNLQTGKILHNTLIFGTALVPNIGGGAPDGIVLGRLGQGEGKPGQSKPWILLPHDEAELRMAQDWLARDAQGQLTQPSAPPTQAAYGQQGTGGWGQQAPAPAPQQQGTPGWNQPTAASYARDAAASQQGGWGSPPSSSQYGAPNTGAPAGQAATPASAPAGGWGAPAAAPASVPDPTGQALFDAFKRKGIDPSQFQSEAQAIEAWQYVKHNPDVA